MVGEPVESYLADLVGVAEQVVGADLVGAYGAGSIGLGAFTPGRSDIDVALVCAERLPLDRRRRLVAALRHDALPCPARGLELVVYRRAVAASGTPEPGFECELNDGARMAFRATYDPADRPRSDGLFWYGLDRSILAQHGRTLVGPPAGEVFADLRPDDLRELLATALRWWMALPTPSGDQPAPGADDAVLGACRSLVRYRDGIWLAKTDAGRRLVTEGREPALIGQAIAARTGGPPPSGPAARTFQASVLDEILAAA